MLALCAVLSQPRGATPSVSCTQQAGEHRGGIKGHKNNCFCIFSNSIKRKKKAWGTVWATSLKGRAAPSPPIPHQPASSSCHWQAWKHGFPSTSGKEEINKITRSSIGICWQAWKSLHFTHRWKDQSLLVGRAAVYGWMGRVCKEPASGAAGLGLPQA